MSVEDNTFFSDYCGCEREITLNKLNGNTKLKYGERRPAFRKFSWKYIHTALREQSHLSHISRSLELRIRYRIVNNWVFSVFNLLKNKAHVKK